MAGKPLLLVFGTSADPFHEGHKALVVESVKALEKAGRRVQKVLIMPVFRHNNLRDDVKQFLPLSYEDRLAICELEAAAIEASLKALNVPVQVSRLEQQLALESHKANFTSETMQSLRQTTEKSFDLAFLIGIDPFTGEDPTFSHWHNLDLLLETTTLIICQRKGFSPNQAYLQSLMASGSRLIVLDNLNTPEISSSEIRSRIEKGEDPASLAREGLISEETADYISKQNLAARWRELDSSQSDESVNQKPATSTSLEAKIGALLFQQKLSLATAESCTGGLISHRIVQVPGASKYFMGGIISYAYEAKVKLLGVRWETLRKLGAVSSEVVLQMAKGARKALETDLGLSVSCIAGPGGATPNKPVGTSWVGLATTEGESSWQHTLHGDRVANLQELSEIALQHLYDYLVQRSQKP
jgi:nicotinamide-nucleotide amidase